MSHRHIPNCIRATILSAAVLAIAACAPIDEGDTGTGSAAVTSKSPSTVLYSDIDDTIKRTGIHGSRVALNALSTTNEFAGMRMLYSSWHRTETATKKITYLSAAPGPAIILGTQFLQESRFPGDSSDVSASVVGGRKLSESAGDFKGKKLIELYDAAKDKPRTIVLIGVNGEQDMIAYSALMDHVKSARGTTKVHSFIHHVYEGADKATPITGPHTPFLTSADLAIRFYNEAWIDKDALDKVLGEVAHDSGAHELTDTVVPSFMECGRFTSWPTITGEAASSARTYETIKANVKDLCR